MAIATARAEAVRLAERIHALDQDLAANQAQTTELIETSKAAPLLDKTGVGTVTAAILFAAGSHPGGVGNKAAFACLAGVSPIPRHRAPSHATGSTAEETDG